MRHGMKENRNPVVGIILVNYNGWSDTLSCLNSLAEMTYRDYFTVVVDNASTHLPPHIVDRVKSSSDIFIEAPRNGGFAYANNIGIRRVLECEPDYILLLNNDTVVIKEFLNKMITRIRENPSIGILGCRINYYDQPSKTWFNGAGLNWWKAEGFHYDVGRFDSEISYRHPIEYVTGCVMLIPTSVVDKVGFLNEQFFLYYEDLAYSLSVRNAGLQLDYVPECLVLHKVSASIGDRETKSAISVLHKNRSKRIFLLSEHYSGIPLKRIYALSRFFFVLALKAIKYCLNKQERKYLSLLREALRDNK